MDGERRREIVVRMPEESRADDEQIRALPLRVGDSGLIRLGQVVDFRTIKVVEPINRDSGHRRAALMVNLKTRDVEGFVRAAEEAIQRDAKINHLDVFVRRIWMNHKQIRGLDIAVHQTLGMRRRQTPQRARAQAAPDGGLDAAGAEGGTPHTLVVDGVAAERAVRHSPGAVEQDVVAAEARCHHGRQRGGVAAVGAQIYTGF